MFKTIRLLTALMFLAAGLVAAGKVYVVSAGVTDYSSYPGGGCSNLSKTANDANDIAAMYASSSNAEYTLLLNAQATKSNITRAIRSLHGRAGADDIVVFFFSGHGGEGGICCRDGLLTFQKLREAMSTSRSRNKMIFLDSCHAGGLRSNGSSGNNRVQQAARNSNIMLFLSSRDSESSYETAGRNGMFTTYLLKGLQGKADANRDRTITARELFNYVNPKVASESGSSQHPVMWGNFPDSMPVMIW